MADFGFSNTCSAGTPACNSGSEAGLISPGAPGTPVISAGPRPVISGVPPRLGSGIACVPARPRPVVSGVPPRSGIAGVPPRSGIACVPARVGSGIACVPARPGSGIAGTPGTSDTSGCAPPLWKNISPNIVFPFILSSGEFTSALYI